MSRPRRRRLLSAGRGSALESLEPRQMFCAAHAATFQWTIPNDPTSLARERLRIASLEHVAAPATYASLTAPAATGDAAGLPILNSNPGAAVDIYLDFDGDNSTGGNQMVTPYDTNGDPSTFDASEQAVVTQAWSLVSTYFAMFDVNVTTDTPTHPFAWCAIGNNVSGGYSFVGVFPQTVGGSPKSYTSSAFAQNRATGIAHEVGHNFGLQHQGDYDALGKLVNEYSAGFDAAHGPFMGVDYAQRVHKWFIGHPSDSVTALQDDMAVISDRIAEVDNGDGYRADDIGNTIAAATTTGFAGVSQMHTGILERLDDADVFSFVSSGGRYLATANRDVESGVDLKLDIYDASNHLIASDDPANSIDASIPLDLPAGTYYARVASHGGYGDLGKYVLTVSPLANGTAFDSDDVGNTLRRAGGASYDAAADAWTLRGAGTDIGSTSDQFRSLFESLHGDGSITARVSGLSNGATLAKAGLMIRESTAGNARHATIDFRNDGGTELLSRATASGATSQLWGGAASAGVWLRLTRLGDVFTAERSADGITWTTIGTTTLAMASDVLIGLAVTSAKDTTVADAIFDHVIVTGNVGPATYTDNGLAAPANLAVVPTATGTGLTATWDAVAGAIAYAVERSSDGVNFTVVAVQTATAYTDAALAGSYRYFYRVRSLVSLAASERSAQAAIASGMNRPSAPTNVTTMSISGSMIIVDWRDTVGETGYRIERSLDGGLTWIASPVIDPNVTDRVYKTLQPNLNYTFRITPLSPLGDGPASTFVVEGTRLDTVSNVRVGSATSSALTVTWNDLNKVETGYRVERSTDATTWSTIANVGGDVTSFRDSGLAAFTPYYYRITAVSPYSEGISGGIGMGATQANQSLPAGWAGIDIGSVAGSGASAATTGGNGFTLIGDAPDAAAGGDQLRYVYRRLDGDGELIARVEGVAQNAGRTGLMFRESLAADARYGFVGLGGLGTTLQFESRASNGSAPTVITAGTAFPPTWFRLVRSGNQLSGYWSSDGSNWTPVGSASVSMASPIYVGLSIAPGASSRLISASFSNVGGSAAGQTDITAPDAPTIAISRDTGVSNTDGITRDPVQSLTGTAEPGATLTLAQNGATIATMTVGYAGTWRYDLPSLADGIYTFTVIATDAAGNASAVGTRVLTIDTTVPAVSSATFDREWGHRWLVQFNDDVGPSLSASDFAIVDRVSGTSATPTLSYDAATHTATLTLAGDARLANGRYELRLASGAVTDLAGNDSTAALAFDFDVLAADFDGNGVVNFADLLTVARNYGKTGQPFSAGNADYDAAGMIGFSDLLVLARSYGNTLPASAATETMTTTSRRRPSTFSTIGIEA